MRLPQFEISKAILPFNRDNRFSYGHFSYRSLAHLQRFRTNVLHTNMRSMVDRLHAAAVCTHTQHLEATLSRSVAAPAQVRL